MKWNGAGGRDYFFQSELPYDPPSQSAWMHDSTTNGYPAFAVGPSVTTFTGYGLGVYSNFDQGVPIEASSAFVTPNAAGVAMKDLFTVHLSGSGGIERVINTTGAAVNAGFGGPSNLVSYP